MIRDIANHDIARRVPQTRDIGGLRISLSTYGPRVRIPVHAHTVPLFSVVLQGGFLERVGRAERACGAGTVLFHPKDLPHSQQFGERRSQCLGVSLGHEWIARYPHLRAIDAAFPLDLHGRRVTRLASTLYHEFRAGDESSGIALEGLTLAILAQLTNPSGARAVPRPASWAPRVREHLQERYQQPVRLAELAELAGVHPVHLSRGFRRHFGCTITEYVRQLRIDHASRALVGGGESLTTIALDTGFADQGHFSRWFKEATGMTPGAYRASAGE